MKSKTSISEFTKEFLREVSAYHKNYSSLHKRITVLEKELNRLIDQRNKLAFPQWYTRLLPKIVKEIDKSLPGWKRDEDTFIPLGLTRRVTVFYFKHLLPVYEEKYGDSNCISITFRLVNRKTAELHFETNETQGLYPGGSIGSYNGMNIVTKPLTSIVDAIIHLKAQIINNKSQEKNG